MTAKRARLLVEILVTVALLAGCGSATITLADATTYWDQQISQHYQGHVATGDGRGCRTIILGQRYTCFSYVQGSGVDVIGTVTISGQNMSVSAHLASGPAGQAWMRKYGH